MAVFGKEDTVVNIEEMLDSTELAVPVTVLTPLNSPDTREDFRTLSAAFLIEDVVVPTRSLPYFAATTAPVVASVVDLVDPVMDCGVNPVCAEVSLTSVLLG